MTVHPSFLCDASVTGAVLSCARKEKQTDIDLKGAKNMKKFVAATLVAIMTVMLAAGALAAGEATPDQATLNGPTAKPAAEPEPAAEEGDFFDKLNLWYRDQFGRPRYFLCARRD